MNIFNNFNSLGFLLSFVFSFIISCFLLYSGFLSNIPVGVIYTLHYVVSLDSIVYVFVLLTLFIGVGLLLCFPNLGTCILLFVSLLSSIMCYLSVSTLSFWIFYESSIIFLLFALFFDSPYSERYLALWYFLGYVLFFSLPMILSIFYVSSILGNFDLSLMSSHTPGLLLCSILISVCFVSKIPLFPFHCWLPIVHAEASSYTSVCLSGYVMKLGVFGLYRFGSDIFLYSQFSNFYVVLLLFSTFFYFVVSFFDFDIKRWMAYLSLAHIVTVALGFYLCNILSIEIPYYYCLGHGLVAALGFILFLFVSLFVNSRSWFNVKSGCVKFSVVLFYFINFVFFISSLPPTISFFSEVLILSNTLGISLFITLIFCLYLFMSALIPLASVVNLIGVSISRSSCSTIWWYLLSCLFFFSFWTISVFLFLS